MKAEISPYPLSGASGEWLFQAGSFSGGILPVEPLCGEAQGWDASRFLKWEHSEADVNETDASPAPPAADLPRDLFRPIQHSVFSEQLRGLKEQEQSGGF